MDASKKITQMRLSEDERFTLERVRETYGCRDWTDTVRMLINWVDSTRPAITISPRKKIPKNSKQTA